MKKLTLGLVLICFVSFNYGCVEFLAAGVLTGAGELVKYSKSNIAHKTFTTGQQKVTLAAMRALQRMGIKINRIADGDDKTKICAATTELDIKIDLNYLTKNTTKVSVNASKNKLLKDKATANEIIVQIDNILTEENQAASQQTNFIRPITF
jgi:hypothetical protein